MAGLKAGDEVAVPESHGFCHTYSVAKVVKTTATQICVGEHYRYRRSDGKRIGSTGWRAAWLRRPTETIRAEANARKWRADLARIQWDKEPLATVIAVVDLVRNIHEEARDTAQDLEDTHAEAGQ